MQYHLRSLSGLVPLKHSRLHLRCRREREQTPASTCMIKSIRSGRTLALRKLFVRGINMHQSLPRRAWSLLISLWVEAVLVRAQQYSRAQLLQHSQWCQELSAMGGRCGLGQVTELAAHERGLARGRSRARAFIAVDGGDEGPPSATCLSRGTSDAATNGASSASAFTKNRPWLPNLSRPAESSSVCAESGTQGVRPETISAGPLPARPPGAAIAVRPWRTMTMPGLNVWTRTLVSFSSADSDLASWAMPALLKP